MNAFELGLLERLNLVVGNRVFDAIMPVITALANNGYIWIVIAVALLLFARYRKAGVTLAVALLTEWGLVNGLLKPLVGRIRPFALDPSFPLIATPPHDASFPSGHAAVSFAAAYVIYHFNKRAGIAAYVLAALIAFSRLYLFFHFPTDVLAGTIIGIAVGAFAVWLVTWADKKWMGGKLGAAGDVEVEQVEAVEDVL